MNLRDKQPPSGGCVLKQTIEDYSKETNPQPPSGGCVLKQINSTWNSGKLNAATFGWLCVETELYGISTAIAAQPPSGGCVLKLVAAACADIAAEGSHLRVAVC